MDSIYKKPESPVDVEPAEVIYGGFWIRLAASLLDTIWVMILTMSLGWMIYGVMYFESSDLTKGYADIFISYVLPFIVTMLFWVYRSATPGKMMLGLKIVDANTLDQASGKKLALRYLGYYISLLGLCFGYFWIGWDPKKQGWHDKIAGTLVIKQ